MVKNQKLLPKSLMNGPQSKTIDTFLQNSRQNLPTLPLSIDRTSSVPTIILLYPTKMTFKKTTQHKLYKVSILPL